MCLGHLTDPSEVGVAPVRSPFRTICGQVYGEQIADSGCTYRSAMIFLPRLHCLGTTPGQRNEARFKPLSDVDSLMGKLCSRTAQHLGHDGLRALLQTTGFLSQCSFLPSFLLLTGIRHASWIKGSPYLFLLCCRCFIFQSCPTPCDPMDSPQAPLGFS